MKRLLGAIVILLVLGIPANAGGYYFPHIFRYYKPPVVAKPVPVQPSSTQKFICIANPAGAFICAVIVGIIVHEVMGPKCAAPGLPNGYDQPTFWRPLCNWKDPISVRG